MQAPASFGNLWVRAAHARASFNPRVVGVHHFGV
jgi:hypothetical protein